jgi:hypothetical protein
VTCAICLPCIEVTLLQHLASATYRYLDTLFPPHFQLPAGTLPGVPNSIQSRIRVVATTTTFIITAIIVDWFTPS